MKKILKINLRVVLGFIAFVALYLLAAWGLSKITVSAEPGSSKEVTIYILTNGVHTDIVYPLKTSKWIGAKSLNLKTRLAKIPQPVL